MRLPSLPGRTFACAENLLWIAGENSLLGMRIQARVRSGLDRLVAGELGSLRGRSVALLCHPASVDQRLVHITECVAQSGAQIASLLGPEHGLDAAAQDMETVPEDGSPLAPVATRSGPPTYSLYGDEYDSLIPRPAMFHDAEILICDLQDVGARYYTYAWTVVLAAEVALAAGLQVWILDRPNPLGGEEADVEGGEVQDAYQSFVGLHDVAVRHGMTIGELCTLTLHERARAPLDKLKVQLCAGWQRRMDFSETGLPWVLPSPNMPTLDTARVYPGQCLLEGTNLSEGRGTTRPFELCGAPFLDGAAICGRIAGHSSGLALRPTRFKPTFQKHAGISCGGLQLHVVDPAQIRSLSTSIALLAAIRREHGGALRWREERYEFVSDRLAIDLLAGGTWMRQGIDAGESVEDLVRSMEPARERFLARRRKFLLY